MPSLKISPTPPNPRLDKWIAACLKSVPKIGGKALTVKKIGGTKANKKPFLAYKVAENDSPNSKLQSAGVHDVGIEIHLVEDRKEAEKKAEEATVFGGTTTHDARWNDVLSKFAGRYKDPDDETKTLSVAEKITRDTNGLHVWHLKDVASQEAEPEGPDLVSTLTFTATCASIVED